MPSVWQVIFMASCLSIVYYTSIWPEELKFNCISHVIAYFTIFFFLIKEVVSQLLARLNSLPTNETPWKPYEPIVWWIESGTSGFASCHGPMSPPPKYPCEGHCIFYQLQHAVTESCVSRWIWSNLGFVH